MSKPSYGLIGTLPGFAKAPTAKFLYNSFVGGWSPFGLMAPLGEDDWPYDLWQGDSEAGKPIASKRFVLAGCDISFSRNVGWHSREGSIDWLRSLHRFDWMRDVLAYKEGKAGAKLLRGFIWDWMANSERVHLIAMEPDVLGARLANWVIHGRFLQTEARAPFRRRFQQHLVHQAIFLERQLRHRKQDFGLDAIKGVLLVSLTMPQCGFLYDSVMNVLRDTLQEMTHEGSAGRELLNPMRVHQNLRSLLEIHAALIRLVDHSELVVLDAITELKTRLRHLLHGDGKFVLFHGAVEGEAEAIAQSLRMVESVLNVGAELEPEEYGKAKEPTTIQPGYARLQADDTAIVIDVSHPSKVEDDAFYSTLAFEMSHAKQRIVASCGAFIGNDPTWTRVVRTTAAHSTLCVDDRNSAPKDIAASRGDETMSLEVAHRLVTRDGYHFFEGDYNGYTPYSGLLHSRQLLINESGTRFSGADHLKMQKGEGLPEPRSHDVNLRFHLHPSVTARRLMNGMVVLTSENHDQEWTFHASVGQAVEVEEGIYLGLDGRPVSTSQIVIYMPFEPHQPWIVEWSFIKT